MEIQNTPDNRAKFFSQYWDQYVLRHVRYKKADHPMAVSEIMNVEIKERFLQLDPVSLITEHHAKELIKIKLHVGGADLEKVTHIKVTLGVDPKRPNAVSIEAIVSHLQYSDFVERLFIPEDSLMMVHLSDYLRYNGFAISWMGVSVDQQLSYGWIKLNTK